MTVRLRRVAIMPVRGLGYGRAVLRGIYRHVHGLPNPWLFLETGQMPGDLEYIARWKPHGVIGHITQRAVAEMLEGLGLPFVTTSGQTPLGWPRVGVDDRTVGRMAAEHYLGLGYTHYAVLAEGDGGFAAERNAGFVARLAEAGRTCHLLDGTGMDYSSTSRRVPAIVTAIRRLGSPLAVFATTDWTGRKLLEVLALHGVRVPDEVAVLGVDNDDLLCNVAFPPLSSIEVPGEQIGYEAACLLDRLLTGAPPPAAPILLPPLRVVARASTDRLAVHDPDLRAALHYIRAHAAEAIKVEDVCAQVSVCRRVLERRFQSHLGRSILQEILRIHVDVAKGLLIERQEMSVREVAAASGFLSVARLEVSLRRATGLLPAAFRRTYGQHG